MTTILLRPFKLATYKELAFLLLGLPMSIVAFTVIVTGVTTGLALLITFVGIPILLGTAYANRGIATVERHRAALVLDSPIDRAYRRPSKPGFFPLARTVATDPQTWRDVGWMTVGTIVSFGTSIAALVLWSLELWAITLPTYGWALDTSGAGVDFGFWSTDDPNWSSERWWVLAGVAAAGILLLPVCVWICAGMARGQASLMKLLLAPTASDLRVEELTRTRAASVDVQASELRRIERDLHDGAQARMVAVTLDLGLAKEKLASDPEAARELVEQAHAEATTAIAELRELVAGIAPAVLTDRGLDAALSSLVATCRIPVTVDIHLPERLPTAVEVAAYFVVAEALTNVQKHSNANHATVHARLQAGRLILEIGDDGTGGADPSGAGLTGLRDRVAALDGTLTVASPAGGPTVVRAEIPCAS